MPTPIISPFGKRQPRALVVGLRGVVKDPKATAAQRLRACELLAIIDGYIDARPQERTPTKAETANEMKKSPSQRPMSSEDVEKLKRLAEEAKATAWCEEKGYRARAESVPAT
jgi:hypothetical protein